MSLFSAAEDMAAGRLLASGLGQLLPGEKVVDLFCGAGGWGAGAKPLGIVTDFAVNHSPVAIEYHSLNHPTCQHHQGDAWKARPRDVAGKATIGLLLASAACTTHSNARGAAPISPRVHMLGWCIARWIKETRPRCILVENVSEWQHWGPLRYKLVGGCRVRGADGKLIREADPARNGQHFRKWIRYCRRLGYTVEFRILDAVDFGAASRRKRLFVMMRRDGQPIVWPEATHGPHDSVAGHSRTAQTGLIGMGGDGVQRPLREAMASSCVQHGEQRTAGHCVSDSRKSKGRTARREQIRLQGASGEGRDLRLPYRTAAEVIDWSDLGTSIFERKRPLKDKTLARIAEGIRRFVLEDASPFVLRVTHGESGGFKVSPIDAPMPTQTTRQDIGVVTPVLMNNTSSHTGGRCDGPVPTITTGGQGGLVTPVMATIGWGERDGQAPRCGSVLDPLTTIPAGGVKAGIVSPIIVGAGGSGYAGKPVRMDRPANTVTCDDHRALVAPLLAKYYGGVVGTRADVPLGTVTTVDHSSVVVPSLVHLNNNTQPSGVNDPMHTILSGGTHAGLVAAFLVQYYQSAKSNNSRPDAPLPCVVTHDRHGLVVVKIAGEPFVIVDILFRMLRPHELAAAMGFPADYVWPKSQRDAVKLIGNAVSPPMATALLRAMLPAMWPRDEREECAA